MIEFQFTTNLRGEKLPTRATKYSSGYDFYSPEDFTLLYNETCKIKTGIKVFLPNNLFLMLVPKSGLGIRGLNLMNTIGVIDSDYYNNEENEGEIILPFRNTEPYNLIKIKKGEKIAQGIIFSYHTCNETVENQRGGGFGSTGA